jgi:hypothetical protein
MNSKMAIIYKLYPQISSPSRRWCIGLGYISFSYNV